MDINIKNIAEAFGLKLNDYKKIRSSYRCVTDEGIKEIKKVDFPKVKIHLAYETQEFLIKKGFANVDILGVTNIGEPFYKNEIDDAYYIVRNWISKKELTLDQDEDVRLATETLAKLHKVAKGFEVSPKAHIRNELGNLEDTYYRRTKELSKIRNKLNRNIGWDKFDNLFFKNFDDYYEKALDSLDTLAESNYYELCEKANREKSFCHHEYAYHNIVFDHADKLIVRDFENTCYDIRVYDLANLIKRYMRKVGWDVRKTKRILDIYNKENTISKEEIKILYSMLAFPQKFWRIVNRHYNKRRVLVDINNQNQLKSVINQKKEHDKYIKEFRKNIL